MSTTAPSSVVDKLRISMVGGKTHIVDDVSFEIAPGEVLGLVGESGFGKTTVGLALLGHARRGVRSGRLDPYRRYRRLKLNQELAHPRARRPMSRRGGRCVGPALRIGTQMRSAGSAQLRRSATSAPRAAEMMRGCAADDPLISSATRELPVDTAASRPGDRVRVPAASDRAGRADDGLDVTTQVHVLGTVRDLATAHGVAAL
jgi:peptide/nickel transport system ATP-binding protein